MSATQTTIHWLGAGLSSGPGIVSLSQKGHRLVLWNRTLAKAQAVFQTTTIHPHTSIQEFSLPSFQSQLKAQDIVVSMLPAVMHPEIAELCLAKQAHLVTTSYISPAMRAYDQAAQAQKLCFVNECGLDPGIDHLLAHLLVREWRDTAPGCADRHELVFESYCGGFPKIANDFKYKFSWSPVGVLRALTNRAQFIDQAQTQTVDRAWEAVTSKNILDEAFEVYPNRDSLPYISEYGFDAIIQDNPKTTLQKFVRGTIRLNGWKQAWSSIFQQIAHSSPESLEKLGADLWQQYAYQTGEPDRVLLYVSLQDQISGWHRAYAIDASGTGRDTAMGCLVSWPATFAVESILARRTPWGVSGAPHNIEEIKNWMTALTAQGISLKKIAVN